MGRNSTILNSVLYDSSYWTPMCESGEEGCLTTQKIQHNRENTHELESAAHPNEL